MQMDVVDGWAQSNESTTHHHHQQVCTSNVY